MPKTAKISSLFPKHLFWDVIPDQLDIDRDKDFIIPRALYLTNKATFNADIVKLETLYSPEQILTQLKNTREKISNVVLECVANRYQVPVFRRFPKK